MHLENYMSLSVKISRIAYQCDGAQRSADTPLLSTEGMQIQTNFEMGRRGVLLPLVLLVLLLLLHNFNHCANGGAKCAVDVLALAIMHASGFWSGHSFEERFLFFATLQALLV